MQGLTDARIETLENTYADRDTALASVIQTLTADVGANSVSITETNTAFASVDATLSQSLQNVITDLAETDATVDGEIVSFFQDSEPTGGHIGDIWFDTDDNNTIYTWKLNTTNNTYDWVATPNSAIAKAFQAALDGAAVADGKITAFYQADAPSTADSGDLWVDTDDNQLYRWNAGLVPPDWVSIRDTTLTQVIQGVADLNATVDGEIVSFFQDSAPNSSHIGDIWFDTDELVSEGGYTDVAKAYVRRDNGSGTLIWEHSPNSALVKAFRDTSAAQDTADGKITAFYQPAAPSTADSGDLWVDTDDNQLYRWDATSTPPAWVSIRDNNLTSVFQSVSDINGILDGQIVSFFQDSEPTSTHVGDFWFDTDNIVTIDGVSGAQPYVRLRDTNGDLEWAQANNSALAKAFRDTSSAQDTADGKITAFYENEPPSTADSGDLWVDTNNGNKLHRWDASLSPPAWASVQDGNIVTLLGKHGVNIDTNGYIIGYDIFNDGTTGSFKIKADEFKIVEGSTANEAGTEVFSIVNGVVTMGEAHIGSLSVGTEKIKDNAVTNASFLKSNLFTYYAIDDSTFYDLTTLTISLTGAPVAINSMVRYQAANTNNTIATSGVVKIDHRLRFETYDSNGVLILQEDYGTNNLYAIHMTTTVSVQNTLLQPHSNGASVRITAQVRVKTHGGRDAFIADSVINTLEVKK